MLIKDIKELKENQKNFFITNIKFIYNFFSPFYKIRFESIKCDLDKLILDIDLEIYYYESFNYLKI